ncbi:HAD family hydrolase [Rouxiella badensis]|jgi:HAD superfamily hydrolase (TIGR01490 family)|uniref:HAD family hydrolase n=1 Tax=Rouxiella badensis TaxID=1646377 RepID=A0A1X0WI20_9GAMM|nr:HAD family hydrolase [Rouxiella badensis]MCC3718287.1 HAD-IB family hydrolase [Rouxiella badensis]MCC3726945.1 HAD-IB family hydrolase [Rouxiella badensis]MCC3738706.1 HAD-IB family hydrolase [Rouxiella badensis]ORJ26436.1 HAD family hydrolase [Rouxiella badensis]QII37808.1 HAD-IB family hydrolase [Rouxiella badensis]
MDLALFDLDKTLISDDSASLWLHWLVSQGYTTTARLDHHQRQMHPVTHYADSPPDPNNIACYLKLTLAPMSGYHRRTVSGWVERFVHRDILPRLYPQARQQIAWHKERGDTIALISASGEHLVTPIARRLGIDHAFGIVPEFNDHRQCFTGETTGELTFHQGTVHRLESWLQQPTTPQFKKTYAYSDSIFDLPLLEFVDYPTIVNGCRALQQIAEKKGWPSVSWQRHPARERVAS